MASEVKANKLSPSSSTTVTLGDASDTITIPTGATLNVVDGVGVASGGTGLASFTAGDILYATGTTTLAKLAKGSAEQVLAMNSGATAPDWGSVDLTVLPTITAAKGGTGQTSYTTGDTVYASGSTAVSKLGIGTARQSLQTNAGATAPEWVNSPQSLMTAAGDILYASGANTLAKLAKGSNDEVLTLAAGVPSWASAAGGGAWALIETKEASTDASIDFTTFSTDYHDFLLIGSGVTSGGDGEDPKLHISTGSGFVTTGSDYVYGNQGRDNTNSDLGHGSTGTAYWLVAYAGTGNATGESLSFQCFLPDVHSTTLYQQAIFSAINSRSDGYIQPSFGAGRYTSAHTLGMDGISMSFSSGVVAGTFTLYGRATS